MGENNKENSPKKKSFIGKLIDELEINKDAAINKEEVKKKKLNPNIVNYDWDEDNPLKGRRVLVTKKSELLRKNYEVPSHGEVDQNIVLKEDPDNLIEENSKEQFEQLVIDPDFMEAVRIQDLEEDIDKKKIKSEQEVENIKEKKDINIEKSKKKPFNYIRIKAYFKKIADNLKYDIDKNSKKVNNKEKTDEEKRSAKAKIFYIVIPVMAILILFGTVIFSSGGSSFALENINSEFIELLDKGDVDKIKSSVVFEGSKTDNYKNSIENFVKLYQEDEEFKEYVKNSINTDSKNLQKDKNYKTNSLIGVVESDRRYVFLEGYKVKITPLSINSESIVTKNIKIGDKEISINEESKVIPGKYDVITEFEFLKLKNTESIKYNGNTPKGNLNISYTNSEIYNENFNLEKGDYEFEIRNTDDEAIVFVDGKNTNITVEEFNNMNGKKLSSENSIAVLEVSPIGYGLSESVALINSGKSSRFNVSYENNLMLDNFIGILKTTLANDTEAFRNSDINMLSTLGGESLDSAVGWIKKNIGNNQYYIRDYTSFLLDKDAFQVKEGYSLSSTSAYIGGYLSYKEGSFDNDDQNPDLTKLNEYVDKKTGIHFKFDEESSSWYVDLWGTTYRNIKTNNVILVNFK